MSADPPPLVVNSMGWVQGMGMDLLAALIDCVEPTHVVRIQGSARAKRFELPEATPGGTLMKNLIVADAPAWSMGARGIPRAPRTAADLRSLRLAYYMAGCLDSTMHDVGAALPDGGSGASVTSGAIARALRAATPFCVPWSDLALCVMHVEVTPAETLRALNGSLVGLVETGAWGPHEPRGPAAAEAGGEASPPRGGDRAGGDRTGGDRTRGIARGGSPAPPAPRVLHCSAMRGGAPPSPCAGIGLVRAVDPTRGRLYVLAPLDMETMRRVDLLAMGDVATPVELLSDGAAQRQSLQLPYLTVDSIKGSTAAVMKSRNNLKRRRLH